MLVAAIDQGSSATKGALFEADGTVVATARAPVGMRREGESFTQDPAELVASVFAVWEELRRAGPPGGLALVCQRSTCLLWEREGARALTRALSWQDRSAAAGADGLAGDATEIARRTGLRLSPYYAATKLAWLLERTGVRSAAEAGSVVAGTLDAFLVHRLTGRPTTEPGHAGRTLLYDLDADRWDPWLLARFGVPPAALPGLLPSVGARGDLGDVPLLALAGDQQAALVGNGGATPAAAIAHFGTGAFVQSGVGAAPRRHDGLLAAVTWSAAGRRRFQLEGAVNSAGSAVDWALRLTGADLAAVGGGDLDPEGLPWCVPAFVGLGAPWWRPAAGAVLAHLGLDSGPAELVGGVLAGVALRVVDCLEALAAAGVAPDVVRASGRLALLPALTGLIADASGVPVEVVAEEEAGLRGAARLARLALGASEATLATAPVTRARREPRWPEARRRRVRERWREAVIASAAI